jgi:hypothetical protein
MDTNKVILSVTLLTACVSLSPLLLSYTITFFVWNVKFRLSQSDFVTRIWGGQNRPRFFRVIFPPVMHWRCVYWPGQGSGDAVNLRLERTGFVSRTGPVSRKGLGLRHHFTVCVLSVPTFHLLNLVTNFYEIWYEHYSVGVHPRLVLFNFLQPVITTRQTRESLRWEYQLCHLI